MHVCVLYFMTFIENPVKISYGIGGELERATSTHIYTYMIIGWFTINNAP